MCVTLKPHEGEVEKKENVLDISIENKSHEVIDHLI